MPCCARSFLSYKMQYTRRNDEKKNESKLSHRQTTMSKTTKWEVEKKKIEREKAYTHEIRNETSVQQRASKTRKSSDIVNEMRRKKRGKGNKSRAKKNKADKMLDLLYVYALHRHTNTQTHEWARALALVAYNMHGRWASHAAITSQAMTMIIGCALIHVYYYMNARSADQSIYLPWFVHFAGRQLVWTVLCVRCVCK